MTTSKEIIGKMIKNKRGERNLTLQQLADLLDVDRQYAWRLENGKINLTMNYLDRIIKEMSCDHDEFLIVPVA